MLDTGCSSSIEGYILLSIRNRCHHKLASLENRRRMDASLRLSSPAGGQGLSMLVSMLALETRPSNAGFRSKPAVGGSGFQPPVSIPVRRGGPASTTTNQFHPFARHELKALAEGLGTSQDAPEPAKWRDGSIIRIQRHFYDGWSSGTISLSVHRTRTQRHFLNTGCELSPFLLRASHDTKDW